jgi:CBS domain-containing protein
MRSPFTGVIFMLELTHDVNVLLPLLVTTVLAHGFTVLTLRRSILTEKVSRRGYHLSREYAIDPLEILFVREVMRTNIAALPATISLADLGRRVNGDHDQGRQRLYPVVDTTGYLSGVVTRSNLQQLLQEQHIDDGGRQLAELVETNPVVAYPDEPLRVVVYRMAETGLTRFPVVERTEPRKLLGMISLSDLLKARVHNLEAERRRERVLPVRLGFPFFSGHRRVISRSQAEREVKEGTQIEN